MNQKVLLFIFTLFVSSLAARAQVLKIVTIGGNGTIGFSGDGGGAQAAQFNGPLAVAVDTAGNIYVDDYYNYRVRKINTANTISTVAGTGTLGYTGNGSIASSAEVVPGGLAIDRKGNLFISDAYFNVIRKVNPLGIISTYAGTGIGGYSGDSSSATVAKLHSPVGLAIDKKGNLFIADAANHVVRKVDTTGRITTYAGVGTPGYFGDGGVATFAMLDSPIAVTVDRLGNLYIADYYNNVIRKVDTTQVITTFAGTAGSYGYSGDGGLAAFAMLNAPKGVAVDTGLNVYISDANNNVIRKVDASGNISTVVGNGTPGFSGDLGPAAGANLNNPCGIAVDKYGSIYIADANNQRVRKTVSNVGVKNVNETAVHIGAFPNPFTGTITVTGLSRSDKVSVCDITGRQVSEEWNVNNEGPQTYSMKQLAAGTYMLQVWDTDGNRKATVKLTKE
jgi:trimeric autotransporter adhesin